LSGESVVANLAGQCDYVVIEDADLTPDALLCHAKEFGLHCLTILDVTRSLRLLTNFAYVLYSKTGRGTPNLAGERIW